MLPFFSIGSIHFFTYPLVLGMLFALSFVHSKTLLAYKGISFPRFNIYFIFCFLASWLGAKVFFLLSVDHDFATKALVHENFWLGGGFVFYGGLIFGGLFTFFYAKINSLSKGDFEFSVPVLLLCHSIGRLGCFMAGCCFGIESDLPWTIDNLHDGVFRHPVQIYESIFLALGYVFFLHQYKKNKRVFLPYILFYACLRFVMEFFRGDIIRGVYAFGISTSQIISLCSIIFIIVYKVFQKLSLR